MLVGPPFAFSTRAKSTTSASWATSLNTTSHQAPAGTGTPAANPQASTHGIKRCDALKLTLLSGESPSANVVPGLEPVKKSTTNGPVCQVRPALFAAIPLRCPAEPMGVGQGRASHAG
jgi:hypothetical protein